VREFKGEDRMMQNFIDVVRSRKTAELYGPMEEGHVSSALCHLGVISHARGQAAAPEAIRERVNADATLAEAYGRMSEHLAANQIDFQRTPLILGSLLTLEEGKERFTGEGAAAANALLTRAYRAPYTVPQLA
jgi:hypothetical protein